MVLLPLLVTVLIGVASPALADKPTAPIDMTVEYKFTLLGISIGGVRLEAKVKDGRYMAISNLRTGGLADFLFKSRYVVLGLGRISDEGAVLPSRYDSDYVGRNSFKRVNMIFDDAGIPNPVAADPTYGVLLIKYPVGPEEKRGSVDPVSAWIHFLTGVSASEEQPCGQAIPVFDGRRRYDLEISYRKDEKVRIGGGKIYNGPSHRCNFLYKPVAGFKPKQMDEDTLPIPPIEAWIAPMTTPSGEKVLIPVKVQADAPVGKIKFKLLEINFDPVKDELLFSQGEGGVQKQGVAESAGG